MLLVHEHNCHYLLYIFSLFNYSYYQYLVVLVVAVGGLPSRQGSFPAGTAVNGVPKVILTVGMAFPEMLLNT